MTAAVTGLVVLLPSPWGLSQGPVMANIVPGCWMLTNSVRPSGENVGPVNSESSAALRAMRNVSPSVVDAEHVREAAAVLGEDQPAGGRDRDVVGTIGLVRVEVGVHREADDELDLLARRVIGPHLAVVLGRRCRRWCRANERDDVGLASPPVDALELPAPRDRTAGAGTAVPTLSSVELLADRQVAGQRIGHRHPPDPVLGAGAGRRREVRQVLDQRCLERGRRRAGRRSRWRRLFGVKR